MHELEQEIQSIVGAHQAGQLSQEECGHLLAEIRDVRAANECAGNEVMFRHIVQVCNMAMGAL